MTDPKAMPELNDAHIIEAVDRLPVACVYVDEFLGQHPLLNKVPEFTHEIDKVSDVLGALYQKIGSFETINELTISYKMNGNDRN
ncbi:hypothetical protein [uncultured Methylophaga sp.]|uniref:hypothetical protein n=1 Tax=uncultured Methylophaga sp. TaxID=285271 RepID=UPI002636B9AA|nr:hypothetical protein [uncultured Methylophaga sp.]